MNMCAGPGRLSLPQLMRTLYVHVHLCETKHQHLDHLSHPILIHPSIPQRHRTVLKTCALHVPVIAFPSLFKVYIRCLNMSLNSCCMFLCLLDNRPFFKIWLQCAATLEFSQPGFYKSNSTVNTVSAAVFLTDWTFIFLPHSRFVQPPFDSVIHVIVMAKTYGIFQHLPYFNSVLKTNFCMVNIFIL